MGERVPDDQVVYSVWRRHKLSTSRVKEVP